MNKNILSFCYCFDHKFNFQAYSSMISLLDNVSEKIKIYVIYNNEFFVEDLPEEISNHKNLNEIKFFQFQNKNAQFPNLDNVHLTEATYYRLYLSEYLDEEIVIYLDADTICLKNPTEYIRNSIKKLIESRKIIAAKTEYRKSDFTKEEISDTNSYFKRLKMKDTYFNAGVMLINLSLWKKYNLQNKFLMSMNELWQGIIQWDQDVINSVIDGDYLELDKSINFFPRELTNKSDFKEILFFHFVGSKKPWLTSGAFMLGSNFYHENFRKISKYTYHIEHIWMKASITELIKALFNLSFFNLKFRMKYINDFYESLRR